MYAFENWNSAARGMLSPQLYDRLCRFRFDSGFSDRLAKENNWSGAFAADAIKEYLRFMYLAAVAPHPVTPSELVDKVWHLHLIYTRSYWDELCGKLLDKALHHDPAKGLAHEDARFARQYELTLALYFCEFGEKAREDMWPRSAQRPDVKARRKTVVVIGAICCALLAAGAASSGNPAIDSLVPVLLLGIVIVLIGAFYKGARGGRGGGDGNGGGGACSYGGGCGGGSHHGGHGDSGDSSSHSCSSGDSGGSGCGGGCGGGGD